MKLIAALGCSLAITAFAQQGHQHAAGMQRKPGPILAATAAFAPDGTLWAAHFAGDNLAVSKSTDGGAHWSAPMHILAKAEPMDGGGDARPNIAIGPDSEIFVTWTRPLGKPYSGEIKLVRSTDRGRTWSRPVIVHADRQEITHRFDAMTVTRDGRLVVAWIDKRDVPQGATDYAGAAVYYAVSHDRGATFRADVKLAEHSCECCRIALLPRDDGSITVFWRHVFAPNARDHALATIGADGSASGMHRATFDEWRVDVCPHHGPSLAADRSGALHAVWYTGAAGKAGVYYGRLDDGVVSNQRRIGGETAEHADIGAIGDRIALVWKEFDGTRSVLRAMRSDDRGRTFAQSEVATTSEASDQPRLLNRDGHFYVFWNTRTEPLRVIALP